MPVKGKPKGLQGGFKPEVAAAVLVTAAYTTDDIACKQFGVSLRSLQNWRKRIHEDKEFAETFATKAKVASEKWAEKLPPVLTKALGVIEQFLEDVAANPSLRRNPAMIQTIVGAFRLLADVNLTSQVLNARLINSDRPQDELPQQVPSEDSTSERVH
jgi:hypothetical protein